MPEIKIFDALPEERNPRPDGRNPRPDGGRMRGCGQGGSEAPSARSGVNPTPVSEKDALENLVEELADIYLYSIVLFDGELDDNDPCNMCDVVSDRMVEIMKEKLGRWKQRLMEKEKPDGMKGERL